MIYPNYCNLDKEKRRHGGQFWEKYNAKNSKYSPPS